MVKWVFMLAIMLWIETNSLALTDLEMMIKVKESYLNKGYKLPDEEKNIFIAGDVKMSHDQIVYLYQKRVEGYGKRTILDFDHFTGSKWPKHIYYYYATYYSPQEKCMFIETLRSYSHKTCLTFEEIPHDDPHNKKSTKIYMNFIGTGCHSPIGRKGQQTNVNIGRRCHHLGEYGKHQFIALGLMHEIGHALGIDHEFKRPDTADYSEVAPHETPSGDMDGDILTKVPFDHSSIMNYPALPGYPQPLDPMHKRGTLNSLYLTFFDAKKLNLAYCNDVCEGIPHKPCHRGGYQDVTHVDNCQRCVCMIGFTGDYCEKDDPGKDAAACNSGTSYVGGHIQCINISIPHGIESDVESLFCNWRYYTLPHYTLGFWFTEIDMACPGLCDNYVEIRYRDHLLTRGPRFCCKDLSRQEAIDGRKGHFISSQHQEVLVKFADWWRAYGGYTPKFELCFRQMQLCRTSKSPDRVLWSTERNSRKLHAFKNRRYVLAERGGDYNDVCKVMVWLVIQDDKLTSYTVSVGKHPLGNTKMYDYGHHISFAPYGIYENGYGIERGPGDRFQMKYIEKLPYGWSDGSIKVTLSATGMFSRRLNVACLAGGTPKVLEFQYGAYEYGDGIAMAFYERNGWSGDCFSQWPGTTRWFG